MAEVTQSKYCDSGHHIDDIESNLPNSTIFCNNYIGFFSPLSSLVDTAATLVGLPIAMIVPVAAQFSWLV